MYRLDVHEMQSENKKRIARITVSPTQERVTLKVSKGADENLLESLLILTNHIRDNSHHFNNTVRGRASLRHNSIQVVLESETKDVKEGYLLDLSDNKIKSKNQFYG